MNAKIKHHGIETISGAQGNQLIISIRIAHSRKYRITQINLDRVSQHWLDIFDDLTSGLEPYCLLRFTWGFTVLQFRPLKGES